MAEYRANTLSSFDISNLLLGLGHLGYAGAPAGALFVGPDGPAEPDSTAATAEQTSSSETATTSQTDSSAPPQQGIRTPRPPPTDAQATPLLLRMESRTLEVLDQTSHQGLANIMWGFTKLRYFSPALMSRLRAAVIDRVDELNCRDLLDVLWSLARQPQPPSSKDVNTLTYRLSRFFTRGMCGVHFLCGFRFCFVKASPVVCVSHKQTYCHALLLHCMQSSSTINTHTKSGFQWGPREYSSLLWSLGTLGTCSDQLINALRPQHSVLLPQCSPMDLTNALWGMARLGCTLPPEAAGLASVWCKHLMIVPVYVFCSVWLGVLCCMCVCLW